MSRYEANERNMRLRAGSWFAAYDANPERQLSQAMFVGRDDEAAAEDLIGAVLADYARVADARRIAGLRVVSVIGPGTAHKSEATLIVESAGRSYTVPLRVVVEIDGMVARLTLCNRIGTETRYRAVVSRNGGRVTMTVPPAVAPPPAAPGWLDGPDVQVPV